MQILHDNFPIANVAQMQLEMIQLNPITGEDQSNGAYGANEIDYDDKKIRDSWIYSHFKSAKRTEYNLMRIAVYVNEILPINQNLAAGRIESARNHCVVVKGLKEIIKNGQRFEFLELDKNSHVDIRLIPVDFPFFEKVQLEVKKIFKSNPGVDRFVPKLNKYGKKLAELKYSSLETNWYDLKNSSETDSQNNFDENHLKYKYSNAMILSIYTDTHKA